MHILIAETNLIFLAEIRSAFEDAGYLVTTSVDGMEAWTCLVSARPLDLLVTRFDLGLGKPPGTALGMYAQSHDPPIPVIYMPASLARAEYADSEHGAVLVKPFSPTDLVQTANRLLGKVPK